MATLALGVVGQIAYGRIGGAIGALIGNRIDHAVLGKTRSGPRLGELGVQTSSYGNPIPKLFGTMRVAGTVIWATDLREDTKSAGGGKSGSKTKTYSYSASFAVALSARPILSVGRIWADGKLLRGAAGDWKSETGYRLYLGGEGQGLDPLIASAEGLALTPAHRGIAYAVFETMQLADYANRIPSLTFEVTADEDDVPAEAIATDLAEGAVRGEGGVSLGGYAASGDSVRGAIETLTQVSPMPLADDGATLRIGDEAYVVLDQAAFGADGEQRAQPALVQQRAAAGTLPDAVALSYYEPTRDYQAGLQRARRDGIGRQESRIELAAAISAGKAKGLAEEALRRAWRERDRLTVRVPWRLVDARAGQSVILPDGSAWRVRRWSIEHMAIELELTRLGLSAEIAGAADAGRATGEPDAEAGATRLVLLDLPDGDASATAPRIWLAAAGTGAGWRRATVSQSLDAGASWSLVGQTALPAVMGSAVTALAEGPATLFDRRGSVEVDLLNAGMTLEGADDAALLAGANLAVLGEEIIQFGAAEQIAARRWRLSRLLRGRRGTEWAIEGHAAGEKFVLLDAARLLAVEVPLAAVGSDLSITALGPGDGDVAAAAALTVSGQALRPPAPVHLTALKLDDGTIRFGWVRRSRGGWNWIDGADAPLDGDEERYRIVLATGGIDRRTIESTASPFDYGPAEQAADGVSGTVTIEARIMQLGTRGTSVAAVSSWTL